MRHIALKGERDGFNWQNKEHAATVTTYQYSLSRGAGFTQPSTAMSTYGQLEIFISFLPQDFNSATTVYSGTYLGI